MAQAGESDPFDELYLWWAKHAQHESKDPPSRERWDAIVLRLLLSEDPDRVRRYRRLEANGPGSLGADAYELWGKTPLYTPNLSVPTQTFREHELEGRGSMRRLMESQGLLDRYNAILAAGGTTRPLNDEEKAKAARAQQQIMIIGCAGIGLIIVMVLTVLLVMALRLL